MYRRPTERPSLQSCDMCEEILQAQKAEECGGILATNQRRSENVRTRKSEAVEEGKISTRMRAIEDVKKKRIIFERGWFERPLLLSMCAEE